MSASIHINENIKDRLRLLARNGETDDELLQRLIKYVEEMGLEEIIKARDGRWERRQKEKADFIPLEEV